MRERFPNLPRSCNKSRAANCPMAGTRAFPPFPLMPKASPRASRRGKVMNAIAPRLPSLIGGSADLDPSTYTALQELGDFEGPGANARDRQGSEGGGWSYAGRNLHFGVREHAMGAILNGLAAHGGTVPFGATFLVFSDYMRPPIRLAALMGLHVIYVFTHDSIALGEDGPTHQPVEHLASLRSIPGLNVIRPGDANETAVAWRVALETRDRPVALILTRQDVPTLDRTRFASATGLRRGGYVLADAPDGKPGLILMATGSEVALIVAAREQLLARKIRCALSRCQAGNCSTPNRENTATRCFRHRSARGLRSRPACRWAGIATSADRGDVLGVERFGASAPSSIMLREYGFTVDNVCTRALAILR